MEKKLTVDRVEEGIAVCFDEAGEKYLLSEALCEGDIISVYISDSGEISVLHKHTSEADEKKKQNSSRLSALFGRGDRKK